MYQLKLVFFMYYLIYILLGNYHFPQKVNLRFFSKIELTDVICYSYIVLFPQLWISQNTMHLKIGEIQG